MKRHEILVAAASLTVGAFLFAPPVTPALAADKTPEQKQQDKEAAKAAKEAAREARHEKAQLANMPKPARESLTAQVGDGKDVDYYKIAEGESRIFGATFKDAKNETVDVRVDREGKVLSRLSGADAAAAGAQVPAAPTPAPAAPVPAPVPAAPTAAPAAQQAIQPGQGVGLEQIPAAPQGVLREQVKGAHDIRFYRAMFGAEQVWEAKFTTADGKDMAVRVDDAGKIVSNKQLDADEKGRTEVKFDSMPQVVKDSMRKETKGHEGAQFYTNTWNGQQVYETAYWEGDKRWVTRLDASGKVVDHSELKGAKHVSDYGDKKDSDRKDSDKKSDKK